MDQTLILTNGRIPERIYCCILTPTQNARYRNIPKHYTNQSILSSAKKEKKKKKKCCILSEKKISVHLLSPSLCVSPPQAAVVVIYVLVILFGCVANVLIVVVILRYRQLHTVTNVFIVSLGLADIALCVFNLPLQLHYQLNDNWAFGSILCSVAMTTFGVPMFASSLFILMIAVDRYMLIAVSYTHLTLPTTRMV